ncbi:acetylcholine receptor subunit beta-like 2 [Symsagittifera roscoffensis]|uniref:acetylcholine receptor subunit beta-like 2 n=1 Tax=Symsagittifera roscoffensis TaxID=84072 RepID=UPI00307B9759
MSGRAKIYCLFFWSLFLILDFFVKQTMATDRFNSPIRPPLWRKNKVLLSRLLNRTSIIGPRHDPTDPVTINVHLQLQQIAEVDFNTQQMVFSAWLYQSWRDDSLKWTRLEYAPRFLRLKPTDIWVPDVGFVNTAENEQNLKSTTILPVRVNWHGIVSWQQPVLISTLCRMDVSYFPYDTQTCSLLMMSFRKHGGLINLCHIQDFVWKTVVGCMCMLTLKSERSYMRKMHENNFRSARCLKQLASYITILTTNRATKNHSSQHTNTDFSDPTEDNLGEGSMQYLSPSVQNFIHNILRAMEATLCDFLTKTREEAVREVTKVQWMILADILDRLFSILFIVITALFALYFRFNVHFRSHQHLQNLKELYDGMEDHAC